MGEYTCNICGRTDADQGNGLVREIAIPDGTGTRVLAGFDVGLEGCHPRSEHPDDALCMACRIDLVSGLLARLRAEYRAIQRRSGIRVVR